MKHSRAGRVSAENILKRIPSGKSVLELNDKQVVFSQGEPAESLFYVSAGSVKLTVVSDQGKAAVIALLGPGLFFGETSLMSGRPRFASSATAIGKCTVVKIKTPTFARLLRDDRQFSALFIAHLVARNIRAQEDLIDQLFNSAEKRLVRLLLMMANFHPEGKTVAVLPKLSQETLAQMIGADRSRVSVFMNKFKKLGLVDYNGEIVVHKTLSDVLRLE